MSMDDGGAKRRLAVFAHGGHPMIVLVGRSCRYLNANQYLAKIRSILVNSVGGV